MQYARIDEAKQKALDDRNYHTDMFNAFIKHPELKQAPQPKKPKAAVKDVHGFDSAYGNLSENGDILGRKEESPTYKNGDEVFKATRSNQPTPERKALGKRGLGRITNRYGRTILGHALIDDFIRVRASDLVGKTIASPEELAAAEILKNPAFEVTQWIFLTQDHETVGIDSYSVRLPSVTNVNKSPDLAKITTNVEGAILTSYSSIFLKAK